MQGKDYENIRKKIIVRAWKDPSFKEKLLKNPRAALKEFGLENIPENVQIKCVQDTSHNVTIVLPTAPVAVSELTEKELDKIAAGGVGGGYTCGEGCSGGTCR
ncbi:MAG: NHLP leader peptide family RiPP precursor [Chlamydiales bacterium]